jgi:tetratricopeptide (TPR) repeat protein
VAVPGRPSAQRTLHETSDELLRAVARMPSIDLGDLGLGDGAPALQPGDVISDTFVIRRRLGAGGMGVVYLAEHTQLQRDVALKIEARASDAATTESALREARMMAALVHENVLPIHQVGTIEGRAYIAMEYVEGGTARQWLLARSRSWRAILDVYVQAGRGLAAAHARGLVHRDFKPDNLLVAEDPDRGVRVRVADFGLARLLDHDLQDTGSQPGDTDASTTKTGRLTGTPAYMAPELFDGGSADARSDQFALCVALYEALYGTRPFAGDSLAELVFSVTTGARTPAPDDRGVPRRIRRAIDRGLSHAPADRHPSMDALLAALTREPWLRRRPVQLALAGGMGLVVAFAASRVRQVLDCADSSVEAPTWNDARIDALADAFTRSGLPDDDAVRDRVTAGLGAWVVGFSDADRSACEATRVHHERSEGRLELARQCLLARREAFEAAVGVLELGDPIVVARAVDVVHGLPSPQECVDLDALEIASGALSEQERRKLLDLRIELQRFSVLHDAGLYPEAAVVAPKLQAQAREIGIPLGVAEVSLKVAQLYSTERDASGAAEAVAEGHAAAIEAGDGKLATSLAIAALFYEGRLRRAEVGAQWDRIARAWVHRLGDTNDAQMRLSIARGAFERGQDRYPEAIAEHERAMALAASPAATTEDRILAGSTLGVTYQLASRDDDATVVLSNVVKLAEATLGQWHPTVANDLNVLAQSRLRNGDLQQGLAELRRAERIAIAVHGDDSVFHAEILMGLGTAYAQTKEFEASERATRRAIEILVAAGPEHRRRLGQAHANLGVTLTSRGGDPEAALEASIAAADVLRQVAPNSVEWAGTIANLSGQLHDLGRDAEALEYADLAKPILVEAQGTENHRTAMLDVIAGEALLTLGRHDEARERCEHAKEMVDAAGSDGAWLHQYVGGCRGGVRLVMGEYAEALDILESTVEEVGRTNNLLLLRIAAAKWGMGRRRDAVAQIEAVAAEAEAESEPRFVETAARMRRWLRAPSAALPTSYVAPEAEADEPMR